MHPVVRSPNPAFMQFVSLTIQSYPTIAGHIVPPPLPYRFLQHFPSIAQTKSELLSVSGTTSTLVSYNRSYPTSVPHISVYTSHVAQHRHPRGCRLKLYSTSVSSSMAYAITTLMGIPRDAWRLLSAVASPRVNAATYWQQGFPRTYTQAHAHTHTHTHTHTH